MNNLPSGTVTFLFTDIEGSTKLAQQYPNDMPMLLARHHEILRQSIQTCNGFIFQNEGDSLAVAFHSPIDALNAAINAQKLLQSEPWSPAPIKVRMGIHTGVAQLNETSFPTVYTGYTTLATTARIMSAGHGGQILLSSATHELIRNLLPVNTDLMDLGEKRLKDLLLPEHLYQLNVAGLPTKFPSLKTSDVSLTNLPTQLSTFIGREKEVQQIKQRLNNNRLVTLTGSGGIGKTRLSIKIASELISEYPSGVWFVELAPLTNPVLVMPAVCNALDITLPGGTSALDVLVDYLKPKKALLVIDNCEHIIDTCAQLCDSLLHNCPHIHIIASSREALGIDGENNYRVPSLSLPNPKDGLQTIGESEAVKLFVERATTISSEFRMTESNASTIAQICQRLDGIALAIELAASRVKMLKVEQIAARLDDAFRLLTGGNRTALPRQQTLRALIDWSYNLLSEEEQTVLRRLSVFMGGWTLEAAEFVCDNPNIFDLLTHLVDKSLVVVDFEHYDEQRYTLLETIRQYAREKLTEGGEIKSIRNRHMEYYCQLVIRYEPHLRGYDQVILLDRLEAEMDNIRAALEWSEHHDVSMGLQLASGLKWLWHLRDHWKEGVDWLERLLNAETDNQTCKSAVEVDTFYKAKALVTHSHLAGVLGQIPAAMASMNKAFQIIEGLDEQCATSLAANAYWMLGVASLVTGDITQAKLFAEKSLALYQSNNNKFGIAEVQSELLSVIEIRSGELEKARILSASNLAIRKELGDNDGIANELNIGGTVALCQGNYEEALRLFQAGVDASREARGNHMLGISVGNLGIVYLFKGEISLARECFIQLVKLAQEKWNPMHKAASIYLLAMYSFEQKQFQKFIQLNSFLENEASITPYLYYLAPVVQTVFQKDVAIAKEQLSQEDCMSAEAEGKFMTLDQALEYAVEGIYD